MEALPSGLAAQLSGVPATFSGGGLRTVHRGCILTLDVVTKLGQASMEKRLKAKLPTGKFQNVPKARSKVMASISGKGNKSTELKLKMALVRAGVNGFTQNEKSIRGRPDFYFERNRLTVFVDGCFWHGCPKCGHIPKTNSDFWVAKIQRNRDRDFEVKEFLEGRGFTVFRIWECELKSKSGLNNVLDTLRAKL